MALHNISLPHPAILVRHAFGPHIVHTRIDIMPLGAMETCGSIRWRQRLLVEKGGQRIIRRGEPHRQMKLPLESQGLAPELLEKVGVEMGAHRILDGMSQEVHIGIGDRAAKQAYP
jgi:hypothetical protein